MHIFHGRFPRFILIGVLNTLVDWSVLNLEIFIFGQHGGLFSYPVYKAVSFFVAVLNSYFFNKRWVFKSNAGGVRAMGTFALVSAIGLGVNVTVASAIASSSLCAAQFVVCANLGALAGSLAAFLANYAGYVLFVFKR